MASFVRPPATFRYLRNGPRGRNQCGQNRIIVRCARNGNNTRARSRGTNSIKQQCGIVGLRNERCLAGGRLVSGYQYAHTTGNPDLVLVAVSLQTVIASPITCYVGFSGKRKLTRGVHSGFGACDSRSCLHIAARDLTVLLLHPVYLD